MVLDQPEGFGRVEPFLEVPAEVPLGHLTGERQIEQGLDLLRPERRPRGELERPRPEPLGGELDDPLPKLLG